MASKMSSERLVENTPSSQGLTLVHSSAQLKHLLWAAALHTSSFQFAVSTFCGLGCVFN
jgi:hypothetical protein